MCIHARDDITIGTDDDSFIFFFYLSDTSFVLLLFLLLFLRNSQRATTIFPDQNQSRSRTQSRLFAARDTLPPFECSDFECVSFFFLFFLSISLFFFNTPVDYVSIAPSCCSRTAERTSLAFYFTRLFSRSRKLCVSFCVKIVEFL